MTTTTHEAVVAVWQLESARVVSGLLRITRDLQLAEDLAQDALVAALESWPADGIPANPGAWLMTVAKRRAIDTFRRAERHRAQVERIGHDLSEASMDELVDQVDHVEDDVLRLMFLTCHPALTPESRAALTLRLVGGLTTEEIARGFLVKDTAVGQRISRAKRTLAESGATLEMPTGAERTAAARRRDGRDLPGLQRGVRRHGRHVVDAHRPLPRGAPAGPDARRPGSR